MNMLPRASLKTPHGKEFNLDSIRMTGDMRGQILNMQIVQEFCNSTSSHAEVIYTFPLPWRAVLMHVDVTIGEKKLTGIVVRKKQAEAEYEETISTGDTAIMLEKNPDHSYSLNLGNLAPQEHCTICVHYAQVLQFEQNCLRLLIPTVIAPRFDNSYVDVSKQSNFPEHLIPRHTLEAEYPFDIELRLHDALTKAKITSPSHPIAVKSADGICCVSLNRQGTLDRDFVLALEDLPTNSLLVMGADYRYPEQYAMLASFRVNIDQEIKPTISLKILVDCSSSMAGDSIAASRRALRVIVDELKEGDRFSLSRFGSHVEHRSRAMWKAAPASKLAAQRWVGNLEANLGGTEMETALQSTFDLNDMNNSDVLLITDGDITEVDSAIASAKNSGHRLFIVGVGSSPSESHLRRLASATGGACDFVTAVEAVEPAVMRMFIRLRSPSIPALDCIWPENNVPLWTSGFSESVFDGDTYQLFALFEQRPEGKLILCGNTLGESKRDEIAFVDFSQASTTDNQLSRMAAQVRMTHMSISGNELDCNKSDIEKIALDYQLVSERSNFLLIHEREYTEKAVEMPSLYIVPHMLPAGHSGIGHAGLNNSGRKDFHPMRKPAVFRRELTSLHTDVATSEATYDIPAFLRKAPGNGSMKNFYVPFSLNYGSVKDESGRKSNTNYWSEQMGERKLSPWGLFSWLNITPTHKWPVSFNELRKIDLSENVLEWLEFVLMHDFPQASEKMIVASFLHVVSQVEIFQVLLENEKSKTGFRQIINRLVGKLNLVPRSQPRTGLEINLINGIQRVLDDVQTLSWPAEIGELA